MSCLVLCQSQRIEDELEREAGERGGAVLFRAALVGSRVAKPSPWLAVQLAHSQAMKCGFLLEVSSRSVQQSLNINLWMHVGV